jgi:hypothetical protein
VVLRKEKKRNRNICNKKNKQGNAKVSKQFQDKNPKREKERLFDRFGKGTSDPKAFPQIVTTFSLA